MSKVGTTNYTWDNNGNLTNDGSALYRYDQANRMISTTLATTTTLFNYNGDGVRLKQVIAGVPTTYTQDVVAPLPVVLQAKNNATTNQYLYSIGTRPVAQYVSSSWQYLLPDALGSVRQIADANGSVLLSEGYEPYGKLLSSSGSATSMFGYAGEQIDQSGLIFLRARYMNPGLGIFTSRDPWSGDQLRPGSMNGFGYGLGNPVNSTDPSGMWVCAGHPDCHAWVQGALDMLTTSGETGRRVAEFFQQYDSDTKKSQKSLFDQILPLPFVYSGYDCPDIYPGVKIAFGDLGEGTNGNAIWDTELDLSSDLINGPMPSAEGATIFGHEISHWKQGIQRFMFQGEALARHVERQLQKDLHASEVQETVRVSRLDPFSLSDLVTARNDILNYGTYKILPFPYYFGGLHKDWLDDLAVPVTIP